MPAIRSTSRRAGLTAAVLGLLAGVAALPASLSPASAGPPARDVQASSLTVHRGGPDRSTVFHRSRAGEGFLDVTVSAPKVSWAQPGNESAVVSAYVDGRYATDIVITSSDPVARQFALGHLGAGRHTLTFHYAGRRSPGNAGVARLRDIDVKIVDSTSPAYLAARYAPVLYGRDVATAGGRGPFQNNHTDTPLVAWHEVLPVAGRPGHKVFEYSVVWSNEDGGTSTSALMGQWGRTTDIEWIYRVEVDAQGRRVSGSGEFQGAEHVTSRFHGTYDGTHPRLQTCTSNNNVCDKVDDPMRFALSTRDGRPASQPREHLMDTHPWTYQVTARELLREGKITAGSGATSAVMGDPRNYLYVAVDHDTAPAGAAAALGLAVDVRLNDGTTFTSNHDLSFVTINRNGPAATTVKLPAGTTASDVASISVRRVPIGADNGASLHVTGLGRAFFLGRTYLPQPSFASAHSDLTLTSASPTAQIWPAVG